MSKPFHFFTESNLIELLKVRASTPSQLLEGIKLVPGASIYYHTHRFLQQHHYLSPEPPNDFAYWIRHALKLDRLGEAFASVDTVSFTSLRELRQEFITILTEYLDKGGRDVSCAPGDEFYFCSCRTFVLPTGKVANNLKEFATQLGQISISSLYFHMFEARLRLGTLENDFSRWFREQGYEKLADEFTLMDPYNMTLENLRQKAVQRVLRYA